MFYSRNVHISGTGAANVSCVSKSLENFAILNRLVIINNDCDVFAVKSKWLHFDTYAITESVPNWLHLLNWKYKSVTKPKYCDVDFRARTNYSRLLHFVRLAEDIIYTSVGI